MDQHIDTWLEQEDLFRLWDVAHGNLPEECATEDEIVEFERVINCIIWHKEGYKGQTIQ